MKKTTLFLLLSMISLILVGCKTQYVPVVQTQTHYQTLHDTLVTHDTLTNNSNTIVLQVDSAYMSRFGIQLEAKEKAWLIERSQLQSKISTSQHITHDTIHDSIPVPYQVTTEVQVEKDLSIWQQILILIGEISLIALLIYILFRYKNK